MIIVAYNLVGCNSEDVLRLRGKEPIDLLYKLKHRPVLVKENQNRTVQMEEGENRRKSDDAIREQRMELCKQFLAGIGKNHKGKRIAQVETVNAEQ